MDQYSLDIILLIPPICHLPDIIEISLIEKFDHCSENILKFVFIRFQSVVGGKKTKYEIKTHLSMQSGV